MTLATTGKKTLAIDTFGLCDNLGISNYRLFGAPSLCPHAPLLTLHLTPHGARRIARGEMWSGYSFTSGTYTHPLHQLAWLFRKVAMIPRSRDT